MVFFFANQPLSATRGVRPGGPCSLLQFQLTDTSHLQKLSIQSRMTRDPASPVYADASDALPMPPLTRELVDACAFGSWFPKFRRITPKASIIPLPDDFVDYLKADGVFLPLDLTSESDGCAALANHDDQRG